MKGLEIARDFFFGWGRPFLRSEFAHLADRVAAARLRGSDVLGGDDEVSRDHDWGPQFDLYLGADYAAHGERLSATINAAAPNPWNGHRLVGTSVRVESIPAWFRSEVGVPRIPTSVEDWSEARESPLYFLRHGTVWFDGTGELSAWRAALHDYPEAVLRRRLAEESFRVWQHGEYNFAQRMAKRRDPLAIAICIGEFVTGVMRIVLLMHGDFTPYWKWLAFEFRRRPESAPYVAMLQELVASRDVERQVELVNRVCAMVHEQLLTLKWVTGKNANPWLLPLLNAKNELEAPTLSQ
jgi:hypothetical protein